MSCQYAGTTLYFNSLISKCNANPKIHWGPPSLHQYTENINTPLNFEVFPCFCFNAKICHHNTVPTSSYWLNCNTAPKSNLYIWNIKLHMANKKCILTWPTNGTTTPCGNFANISSLTISHIFNGCSQIFSSAKSAHLFLYCPLMSSIFENHDPHQGHQHFLVWFHCSLYTHLNGVHLSHNDLSCSPLLFSTWLYTDRYDSFCIWIERF